MENNTEINRENEDIIEENVQAENEMVTENVPTAEEETETADTETEETETAEESQETAETDNEPTSDDTEEETEENATGDDEPKQDESYLKAKRKKNTWFAGICTAAILIAAILTGVLSGKGRTAECRNVINLIKATGTITVDSGEQLQSIEIAYNKLSAEEKNRVTNYGSYLKDCKKYEQLMLEDAAAKKVNENAQVIIRRAAQTQLTGASANFPELLSEAEKLLKDKSISKETKEELTAAVETIQGYQAFAQECAACYVKAFNRVYKMNNRTVTKVGCIINIIDGKQENWYALTYTEGDTEGTVYAQASVNSVKGTNTIVSNPDYYFADKPVSTYNAIENANTTIDLDALNLTVAEE